MPDPADLIDHNEYQGLLDAVLAAPADDAPRLILADWLDDHNQAVRAELIRLQCLGPGDVRREEHLIGRLERPSGWKWRHEIDRPLGPPVFWNVGIIRRGFVDEIILPLATFLREAADLFSACPIEKVGITCRHPIEQWGSVFRWFCETEEQPWHGQGRRELLPACLYTITRSAVLLSTPHATEAEAMTALSHACVAYGRELARLARQEKGSP